MAKSPKKAGGKAAKSSRGRRSRLPKARMLLPSGPSMDDVEFAAQNFARIAVNASPDVKRRRGKIQKMLVRLAKVK